MRRRIISEIILSFLLLSMHTAFQFPKTASAVFFRDGFETGDFTQWTDSGGSATVVTNPVYAGTYAAAIPTATSYVQKDYTNEVDSNWNNRYLTAYIYFSSTTTTSTGNVLMKINPDNSATDNQLRWHTDGDLHFRWYKYTYGDANLGSITRNTWHKIVMFWENGLNATIWIDDIRVFSTNDVVGCLWKNIWIGYHSAHGGANHFYIDQVIVSDTYPTLAPEISNVQRDLIVPNYYENVVVAATITDHETDVDRAVLSYTYGSMWCNCSMDRFDDLFNATIPMQPYGANVQYKIYANDTNGNWAESSTYYYTIDDNIAPEFVSIQHIPTCPPPYVPSNETRADEPVLILANITEPTNASGVAKAILNYRLDNGNWWNTTMIHNESISLWTCLLPSQPGNTTIEFNIIAQDHLGNINQSSTSLYNVKSLLHSDLNGDLKVDIKDVAMVAIDFGKVG